tara:strand:- start:1047 stop:1613 length:567 start_codon:yes stop_codon:yes gene_type:complete
MACVFALSSGVPLVCSDLNASIGVDKDLILVNYDEFDRATTLGTLEADATNNNEGGLTNINLLTGATQYVFEGTDYSVVPTVTPELKEDGTMHYMHSVLFTAYSKTAQTRLAIESLGGARVIAIAKDRSTGLFELFGADQGLSLSGAERPYTGSQKSNFYDVTISTPEIGVIKESTLGLLAVNIITAS